MHPYIALIDDLEVAARNALIIAERMQIAAIECWWCVARVWLRDLGARI